MDIEQIKNNVFKALSKGRFKHILGVAQTARELAQEFSISPVKAEIAGLLHDISKEYKADQLLKEALRFNIPLNAIDKYSPHLLHARVGAFIAYEQFNIKDPEILGAISHHTLGKANMSLLEQILFLADAIEPNRPDEWADPIRFELKNKGLNSAIIISCKITIEEIIKKGFALHPLTIETYNFYLMANQNH